MDGYIQGEWFITLLPGLMDEDIGYKPFKNSYPCFFQ